MPGESDPVGPTMPQQPLHTAMLPKASDFVGFETRTNPYWCDVGGARCGPLSRRLKPGAWDGALTDRNRIASLARRDRRWTISSSTSQRRTASASPNPLSSGPTSRRPVLTPFVRRSLALPHAFPFLSPKLIHFLLLRPQGAIPSRSGTRSSSSSARTSTSSGTSPSSRRRSSRATMGSTCASSWCPSFPRRGTSCSSTRLRLSARSSPLESNELPEGGISLT